MRVHLAVSFLATISAASNLSAAELVFTAPTLSFPESVVAAGSGGYFVSLMMLGEIRKYNGSWAQDSSWRLTGLDNPGGLAINAASSTLYNANGGGVSQFSISGAANPVTAERVFSRAELGLDPNALCLDADERFLYATDPGATSWGSPAAVTGLAQIDLQTGTVKQIFNDLAGVSPNGCTVMDGIIYMAQVAHGVGSYNPATGVIVKTLEISTELKAVQILTGNGGDGMVAYAGSLFVSSSAWVIVIHTPGRFESFWCFCRSTSALSDPLSSAHRCDHTLLLRPSHNLHLAGLFGQSCSSESPTPVCVVLFAGCFARLISGYAWTGK